MGVYLSLCRDEVQGLSSELSGLQIDISQPPKQLEISMKHQYAGEGKLKRHWKNELKRAKKCHFGQPLKG